MVGGGGGGVGHLVQGLLQAANPLPVADSVRRRRRLSPQAAPSLFTPHPRRSCDSHMVSLPSLISEKKSEGRGERRDTGGERICAVTVGKGHTEADEEETRGGKIPSC